MKCVFVAVTGLLFIPLLASLNPAADTHSDKGTCRHRSCSPENTASAFASPQYWSAGSRTALTGR